MTNNLKPSVRKNNPDHIIFHVGTSDILSEKPSEWIAKSTVALAAKCGSWGDRTIIISEIVTRSDQWNNKVLQVNNFLK